MSEAQTIAPGIQWRIDAWFPELTPSVRQSLKQYFEELLKFNKTLNLISLKTVALADAIHFADSLQGSKVCIPAIKEGATIFDIGSGNGFPGLVMAIVFDKFKFVLVEPDSKKADFLKHVVSSLKLKNVDVVVSNIENLPADSVEFGVTRGFANISKTILAARKCFKPEGVLFHFKSEQWSSEVVDIPTQLCSSWAPALFSEYKLPIGSTKLAIVKTTKINR